MAGETPPRTWGRLDRLSAGENRARNTPTHVGKTAMNTISTSSTKKHPHARGEDTRKVNPGIEMQETPPRTWGRLSPRSAMILGKRNTPTHVGKTQGGYHMCTEHEKHPHARGEDLSMRQAAARA